MNLSQVRSDVMLSVKDLRVSIGEGNGQRFLVDGVTFKVKKGETFGLVGESGSGKTATIMAALRLFDREARISCSGEAVFSSPTLGPVNLLGLPSKQMRKVRGGEIGLVFQDPMNALNPSMRCGQQVAEVIKLHTKCSAKEAAHKTLALFEEVDLPDPKRAYRAYPHELSGGQQQRVMIAQAISCEPTLLVADEPTTSLDVSTQASIIRLIDDLKSRHGMATVFISHDFNVVSELADTMAVMYKGEVVEKGSLWEVFSLPKHPYTKGLLASRVRLDAKLRELPEVEDFFDRANSPNKTQSALRNRFSSVGEAIIKNYQLAKEDWLYDAEDRSRRLLDVKDLSVHYTLKRDFWGKPLQAVHAVQHVSFSVNEGEVLGLVGRSGCGKSTIARSISQLIPTTAGEIFFDGKPVHKLKGKALRKFRRQVPIVFQDPYASLDPLQTIGEAIMQPMKLFGMEETFRERQERTIELLEIVKLPASSFNQFPHEFSGGQRQRICIARALALSPKMLICDESLSSLDLSVQAKILNLLNFLKQKFKLTFLFISHDISVVKYFSDRIAVMSEGKVVEQNQADELFAKPQHPATKKLINSVPKGNLEEIRAKMLMKKLSSTTAKA